MIIMCQNLRWSLCVKIEDGHCVLKFETLIMRHSAEAGDISSF